MQTIKLDLVPGKKMPILNASQYDNGREFRIDITENKVPYTLNGNETISLIVHKCDNNLVTMDIANVYGGKTYIEVATTEQMTACAGFNVCEIVLEENGTRIGSLNAYLLCEQAADEGGITSQSQINNLNRQITDEVDRILPDMIAEEVPPIVEQVLGDDYYSKTESDETFATKNELQTVAGDIPTKTSELTNDSNFATTQAVEEETEALQSDLDKLAVFGEYNPHSFLLESNLYADGGLNLTYTTGGLVANNPLPVANRTATFNILNVGIGEVVTFSFDIDDVIPIKIVDVTTQEAYYDANTVSGRNTITLETTGGSIGFRFTVPYTKSQITISNAVYTKASETTPTVIKTEVLPDLVKDAANAFKAPITYNQLIDYENINKYKTMSYSYGVTTYNDFVDSDYLFASNLIAVSVGKVISFNQKPEYIFLYRSTGISQGRVSGSGLEIGDSGGYEYTIPSNVSYVIIVYLVSNNEKLLCELADKYDSDDEPLNYGYVSTKLKDSYYNESTIKELVGNVIPTEYNGNEITVFKKGICVGDSLTKGVFNTSPSDAYTDESRSYPTILSKMMNTPITNTGIGGATTSDWYDAYENTDLSGHDFAIIQLGVNDSLSPSGWDETSNTALSNIISKLKTDNQNIKIFVATIVPAPAYHNYKQYKASEAIKAFVQNAADEDVVLVDIAKYGHELQSDAYSAQHLTAIGYQRLARDYFSMISKYISDHLSEFKWVQFIGTNNVWHT